MAIGTSSPEFFTNLIGTFVTKGDIGVGSVIGSVVFNILAIVAWCGLLAKEVTYKRSQTSNLHFHESLIKMLITSFLSYFLTSL